jgi:glycosyltransferase involved in cell wall biosynthesis
MRLPLISIVIPVYRKTFLKDQLQYIINNRGFDNTIEVIVVENPQKTDEAAEIIESFGQSNIIHLESEAGANRARNTGIAAATSDRIALLDDDCFPEQGWLQSVLGLYSLYPRCNVYGGAVVHRYLAPRPRWFHGYLRDLVGFLYWDEHTVDVSWRNSPVDAGLLSANLSFRKSVWEAVGGFEEHIGQQNGHQPAESCADEIAFINRCGILPNNHHVTRMYCGKMLAWHNIPADRMSIDYLQKKAYGHGKGTVETALIMQRHEDDYIEDIVSDLLIPQYLSILNEHDLMKVRLEIAHEESTRIFVKNVILCRTAYYQGFMDAIAASGRKSYEDQYESNPLFFTGDRLEFSDKRDF